MSSARRVKRRNSYKPVHTFFTFEIPVCILTLYKNRSAFYAGFVSVEKIHCRHTVSSAFRKALVHTQKHLRPVLRLRAAGTGMN